MELERGSDSIVKGNGISMPTTVHNESSHGDGEYPIIKAKLSRSSSSSSSSASSFDPLTDSDDGEKDTIDISITKSKPDSVNSPSSVRVVTLPETSAQMPEWSMISASPRAGPGPNLSQELSPQNSEWSMPNASPKQFPPVQTMGRPISGYDPNRIPTSIFTPKPATPMEWSVASNESLFSIHMGNNSFSRDHAILLGKAEELNKVDELSNLMSIQQPVVEAKSNESNNSLSPLPTLIEVAAEDHGKSGSKGEDSSVKTAADEKPKVVVKEKAENHSKEIKPPVEVVRISTNASNVSDGKETHLSDAGRNSASTPRLSDESGHSSSSFAFPVLSGEGGSTTSVRVNPENLQPKPPEKPPQSQPPQPQVMNPSKTSDTTRWFPCFSCRLLCC